MTDDAASLAERFARMAPDVRAKAFAALAPEEAEALLWQWRGFFARPAQVAPDGDWSVWLVLAGRGFGKTRSGAEWIREEVCSGRAKRIALVGETQKDLEGVMVFGDSGLANVFPPHQRPKITKKPIKITFHTGAIAEGFNATEPDQLRGPQFDTAWCDELAKWAYAQDTWDQLQFGLRLGNRPRTMVTTTPRNIPIIRDLIRRSEEPGGGVVVTRGRTADNRVNLAPSFVSQITDRYGGTRLGRQELDAEVLTDVPGALWTAAMIDRTRLRTAPPMKRIGVAVDPAVTSEEDSDEHGIIVAGISEDGRGIVLDDASIRGTPDEWARRAISVLDRHEGEFVVVEVNQGGEMVASTLRTVRPTLKIKEVRASRGKHIRAEPIAALYEQGRVSHVGTFAALEDQMMNMTPSGYLGRGSPDRLDALVWILTELFPAMTKPVRPEHKPQPLAPSGGASWMAR